MSRKNKHKNLTHSPEIQVEFIKTSKLGKFSFQALKVLVYAAFLAPLFFFWSRSLVEFLLPKNILFIAFGAVTAVFLIIHFVENRPVKITRPQKILFALLGVWLLFRLVTLLASADVARSFWGGPTRYEGDILFFALSVFTVAVTQVFKTKKQINRFLLVVSLVAGVLAFYGVIQKWGVFFFNETWKSDSVTRASSLFGNPLFLSSFLVITLFFAVYSLCQKANRHLKYELAIAIFFQAVAIVLAECSSTYLALAAALVAFGVIYLWNKKKIISTILLIAAVGVAVFLALTSLNAVSTPATLRPALKDFNLETQSNAQRYYVWSSAGQAFLSKPLIGWGNEMMVMAFNRHRDSRLVAPMEVNFDRAHSFIFDQLIAGGLLGCGLFLAILFYAVLSGYKKYRESSKIFFLIMAIIPLVFIVNMFFSIPVLANYLLLFLAVGLIFSREADEEFIVEKKTAKKALSVFVFLAVGGLWLVCFSFKPLVALVYCKTAVVTKDLPLAVNEMNKSLDIWVFEESVRTKLQMYIKEMEKTDGQIPSALSAEAAENARYWANEYPLSFMVNQHAGEIFSFIDEAEMDKYFARSLELAPTGYETYWAWGDAYLRRGNNEKAIEKYQAAVDLNPAAAYPREKLKRLEEQLKKE